MIQTYPKFYYGFEITQDNLYLDFKEGTGPELTAELEVGSYSASQFCVKIKTALNIEGAYTYDVTFNRTTRAITIASTGGSHKLLSLTGSHRGSDPFSLMGFTNASDTSLATSHTGTLPAGDQYSPQIWLQSFTASRDLQGAVDASVNRTASGIVEVIKFGTEKFMECNITLASSVGAQVAGPYRASVTGEQDLRRFLQFLTTKAPVEFMPDENDLSTFETMLLESTSESATGVKYRMKELYDRGLLGYFESGKLVFRIIEDV